MSESQLSIVKKPLIIKSSEPEQTINCRKLVRNLIQQIKQVVTNNSDLRTFLLTISRNDFESLGSRFQRFQHLYVYYQLIKECIDDLSFSETQQTQQEIFASLRDQVKQIKGSLENLSIQSVISLSNDDLNEVVTDMIREIRSDANKNASNTIALTLMSSKISTS